MSEKDIVEGTKSPNTKESLLNDLKHLGIKKGDIIIAHASMSKLGWVVGREVTVIDALLEAVGTSGTLIMPSQTGDNSDPTYWQNPPVPKEWIPIIKEHMLPYDPRRSPTRAMGKVVDALLSHPKCIRSNHPQVSFCGIGKEAEYILANHELSPGLGKGSPLQKLYDKKAKILLLGVGYDNCTSLHLPESQLQNIKWHTQGSRMMINGISQWIAFEEICYDDEDFTKLGENFEREHFVAIAKVGNATCRLIGMQELCNYALVWLKNNRTLD